MKHCTLIALIGLTASPALAHVGDHSGRSLSALGRHLLEADHLFFVVAAIAVAAVACAVASATVGPLIRRLAAGVRRNREHGP